MAKCETCKMKRLCDELERMGKVPKHEKCRCYSPAKPLTNYDLLVRKTPEELAYFMANIEPCRESAWLDWLKLEVTDG